MGEATLNPPSLEQVNKDLAKTVSEEMRKNEIYREALERIFRADGTTMGENPRSVLGKFQGYAEQALAAANQVGKPYIEYWVEPIPGLGGQVPPFKAADKVSGLNFVSNNAPLYQLRPVRKD